MIHPIPSRRRQAFLLLPPTECFSTMMLMVLAMALFAWYWPDSLRADEPAADTTESTSKEKSDEGKFLRLTRDENGTPLAMETAIVRYHPRDDNNDLVVDLVGAVHIGEKSYYEALNEQFTKYDVLLYELVAPEGTRVPRGGQASAHPISMMQMGMKNMLGLESQMVHVDYQKDNFVHADMSPEVFQETMAGRGESFLTMFFRMMGQGIAEESKNQGRNSDMEMLLALFDPNRSFKLKLLMAEQFEDLEGAMGALQGPDGSTIITERNKVALGVLREQIDAGHKKIGIFYGAGHLSNMQERLVNDFGLERGETKWLEAWNLRPKKWRRR
jgi:hypothetical protein